MNDNHSIAYCLLSYLCAYYRCYYPYEFVSASLNCATSPDHIKTGTAIAKEYGVKISPPKFGASTDKYAFNKEEHLVAKGVSSIKYLNSAVANQLYDIYPEVDKNYFCEVVIKLNNETSINARQLDILTKIGYFSHYGNQETLLKIIEMCEDFKMGERASIKKDSDLFDKYKDLGRLATVNFKGVNDKGQELKTYTVKNLREVMKSLETEIRNRQYPDWTYKQIIDAQTEYLGYVDLITNRQEDRTKLYIHDLYPLVSKSSGEPWAYAAFTRSVGTGKEGRLTIRKFIYDKNPIFKGNVINVNVSDLYKQKDYWYPTKYSILT